MGLNKAIEMTDMEIKDKDGYTLEEIQNKSDEEWLNDLYGKLREIKKAVNSDG